MKLSAVVGNDDFALEDSCHFVHIGLPATTICEGLVFWEFPVCWGCFIAEVFEELHIQSQCVTSHSLAHGTDSVCAHACACL